MEFRSKLLINGGGGRHWVRQSVPRPVTEAAKINAARWLTFLADGWTTPTTRELITMGVSGFDDATPEFVNAVASSRGEAVDHTCITSKAKHTLERYRGSIVAVCTDHGLPGMF